MAQSSSIEMLLFLGGNILIPFIGWALSSTRELVGIHSDLLIGALSSEIE